MTTSYDLPMPGEQFDTDGIVIASTWVGDDDALLIVLRPRPPFYNVLEVTGHHWTVDEIREHHNINHAVADYADSGGDV